MASRSLGTLTYDLVAKIGGFTAGMSEAERAADKSAKNIEQSLKGISVASFAVGTAMGSLLADGVRALASAFPDLIDQAGAFQDIADKTGGSAEGFANFAVSAKVAGVSVEDLATQAAKLQKTLLQAGDDAKPITAGLKALNINIAEFKALKPDEQIKALAVAFGQFAEGGEKAAVAQQILGRAGADTLKFFKDYVDNGGDVNILTAEMIQRADDFGDANKRAQATLSLYASAIATEFLPVITAFKNALTDLIKEAIGLDDKTTDLGKNNGVAIFAENAGRELARMVDYVSNSVKELKVLIDFVESSAKAIGQAAAFDFKGVEATGKEFRDRYGLDAYGRKVAAGAGQEAAKTFVQAYDEQLAKIKASAGAQPDTRPKLNPTNPSGRGRKDNSAAQEAKAQLQSDLADIKAAQDAIVNTYTNAGKILEAERSAGLKDEQEYYAEKKRLLLASNDAEQAGLQQQIARLQAENLSGKEAIDNQRKITESQAKLTKAREDAATAVQVLAIQEEAAYKKIASSLLAARQAAQDYFDTTNRGYERTLAAFGQGSKQRDILAGISQIEEKYQQQRTDLANRRSQAELAAGGTLTAAAQKTFDDQLAIINEFESKSISSYQAYTDKKKEIDNDWSKGATEALQNYIDHANDAYTRANEIFTSLLGGFDDALTDTLMGKGGKDTWLKLGEDVGRQIIKGMVQKNVTAPLADWLQQSIVGQGGGGFLGGLFGSSSGGGGGDALGALIKMNGWASGGFTGFGNPAEPAGIVHKGEFVLNSEQTKAIGVNNLRSGNLGGMTQNLSVNIVGIPTNNTATQIAQEARRRQQTAAARF